MKAKKGKASGASGAVKGTAKVGMNDANAKYMRGKSVSAKVGTNEANAKYMKKGGK